MSVQTDKIALMDEIMVQFGNPFNPKFRIGSVVGFGKRDEHPVIDFRTDDGSVFWCYPHQIVSHCGPNV